MSRGVNRVILVGNAGKDPEVKYTQSGTGVANFSLAVTERQKQGGEWKDHTEWVNLVAWGKTAETCGQYVKKGTTLYVEGRLQTRKWQDREGNTKYTTEVVVGQLLLLGSGQKKESPAPQGDEFPGFDPNSDVPF